MARTRLTTQVERVRASGKLPTGVQVFIFDADECITASWQAGAFATPCLALYRADGAPMFISRPLFMEDCKVTGPIDEQLVEELLTRAAEAAGDGHERVQVSW